MLNRIEAKLAKISQSFFYFMTWMVHWLIFSLFVRIRVEGSENIPKKGRFILAGNHQNFFDGFLLTYTVGPFRKISFIIAKRAVRLKLMRLLARLIGSVLIGNQLEEYQRSLKRLNKILSHGGPVGIFPEGDVSKNIVPRKFKGGVAKLSLDSKTKVIPAYLSGTYNLRYFKNWLKRPEILIRIGKSIELYNYAKSHGNDLDEMASLLREKVMELYDLNVLETQSSTSSNEQNHSIPRIETVTKC